MPTGPAARVLDPVIHPLPSILSPGPGSLDVLIGGRPAWRGVPLAAAAGLLSAKSAADSAITTAQAATAAAAGTPGAPAAKLAEEATKAAMLAQMSSAITASAGGADIHICVTPLPLPPHGPGVVIDGSPTVMINGLPACRVGDTILEAIGPPNKIAMGEMTVIIGQAATIREARALAAASRTGAHLLELAVA
jgi:uncharacterized Zn-binding protein involved in type VI secretion